MTSSSPKPNSLSRGVVRFSHGDTPPEKRHYPAMGRKRIDTPSTAPAWDWYLTDWMASLKVTQTQLREAAGWSRASASDICNGKTGYSRRVVNEAANALNVQPYELLMHPDEAMALRRQRENALRVVEVTQVFDRDGTNG